MFDQVYKDMKTAEIDSITWDEFCDFLGIAIDVVANEVLPIDVVAH